METIRIFACLLCVYLTGCVEAPPTIPIGTSQNKNVVVTLTYTFDHSITYKTLSINQMNSEKDAKKKCYDDGFSNVEVAQDQRKLCKAPSSDGSGNCNRWVVFYKYRCVNG